MTRTLRSLGRGRADDGFTLVELLVAMLIFAILLTVVSVSIASMFSATAKTQGIGDATTQNQQAFIPLEREFRTADQVELPYVSAGDEYLQFEALDDTGTAKCYQWRYLTASHQIQQRSGPTTATGWTGLTWATVANGVMNDTTATNQWPFQAYGAADVFDKPALQIYVVDHQGGGRGGTSTLKTIVTAESVQTVNASPIPSLTASPAPKLFSTAPNHAVCNFGGVPQ